MDTIVIIFVMLILSLIGGGIYYVFYYRKEGEECALDEKDDKYDEFGKFKYNDKKECVLDSCKTGYKKVGDSCVGSDPDSPSDSPSNPPPPPPPPSNPPPSNPPPAGLSSRCVLTPKPLTELIQICNRVIPSRTCPNLKLNPLDIFIPVNSSHTPTLIPSDQPNTCFDVFPEFKDWVDCNVLVNPNKCS